MVDAKDQIETYAAAAVAQTNLEQTHGLNRSYDDGLEEKPSFARHDVKDEYGLSMQKKWA